MTYRQYSDHIKLCLYLGKEPGGEFKEFYDFLTELWDGMEFTVVDKHNKQGIIFHKGDEFFMEQDFKNGWFECNHDRVWSFFRTKKCMGYTETQDFIQRMVEEHLKCRVLTPTRSRWHRHSRWKNILNVRNSVRVLTPSLPFGLVLCRGGRASQMSGNPLR